MADRRNLRGGRRRADLCGGSPLHLGNPADAASGDDDDPLLRDGLLVAGSVGILGAGLVGFLAARRAVAPLQKALALPSRFVADAGHELRTPLAVLHSKAQLLARRIPRHARWRINQRR